MVAKKRKNEKKKKPTQHSCCGEAEAKEQSQSQRELNPFVSPGPSLTGPYLRRYEQSQSQWELNPCESLTKRYGTLFTTIHFFQKFCDFSFKFFLNFFFENMSQDNQNY